MAVITVETASMGSMVAQAKTLCQEKGRFPFFGLLFKRVMNPQDSVAHAAADKKRQFSYGATGAEDVASDESMIIREVAGAVMPDDPAFHLGGLTTAINAFMGALALKNAHDRYGMAISMHDQWGMSEAMLDMLRGGCQSVAGGAFGVYRISTIIAEAQKLNVSGGATTAVGQVSFWSGNVGNALFGIFYAIFGAMGLYNWVKLDKFQTKVEGIGIQNYLKVDGQKRLEKMLERSGNEWNKVKVQLQDTAKARYKECMREVLAQAGKSYSEEECERAAQEALANFEDTVTGQESAALKDLVGINNAQDLTALEWMGLFLELGIQRERRETKAARSFGCETVEKVKKFESKFFSMRLKSSHEATKSGAQSEIEQVKADANKQLNENKWTCKLFFIIGLIGFVATILSFALPPVGIVMAVTTAMFVLTAVLFLYIDGKEWFDSLKSSPAGKKDYAFLIAMMVMAVGAFIAACFLSSGIPLILTGVLCALWVGLGVFSFAKTYFKNQLYEKEHPTMESFAKRVSAKAEQDLVASDKELIEIFKRLPKLLRQEVKKALWDGEYRGDKVAKRTFKNPADAHLNQDFKFGENFFFENPLADDVMCALERCVERELIEEDKFQVLFDMIKNGKAVEEIKKYVREHASAFALLFHHIWLIHTENATKYEKMVKTKTFADLSAAIGKVQEMVEKLPQREFEAIQPHFGKALSNNNF